MALCKAFILSSRGAYEKGRRSEIDNGELIIDNYGGVCSQTLQKIRDNRFKIYDLRFKIEGRNFL